MKRNKKLFSDFSILLSIAIMTGCFGLEPYPSDYHPKMLTSNGTVSIVGTLEESQMPGKKKAVIYKNFVDLEVSEQVASECLDIDVSEFEYQEIMFDENTGSRTYSLPDGNLHMETDTGYWSYYNYQEPDDRDFEERGFSPQEFISDDEVRRLTKEFIVSKDIFGGDDYYMSIGEHLAGGGWNENRRIVEKTAYVYPNIDGLPVYGIYRVMIDFDHKGNIGDIVCLYNSPQEFKKVWLKTCADINNDLADKNYTVDTECELSDCRITDVRLAYHAESYPNDKGEFYIYPVYNLDGVGINDEGETEEFEITIDAIW